MYMKADVLVELDTSLTGVKCRFPMQQPTAAMRLQPALQC